MKYVMKHAAAMCAVAAAALTLASCAAKSARPDLTNAPANDQCDYMRETCAEAARFEAQFASLTREEQQEARNVLSAFQAQCESMQELCAQTMR